MPASRTTAAPAKALAGLLLAAGQCHPGTFADVDVPTWLLAAPMEQPRFQSGMATLGDGRVLVTGGD